MIYVDESKFRTDDDPLYHNVRELDVADILSSPKERTAKV